LEVLRGEKELQKLSYNTKNDNQNNNINNTRFSGRFEPADV
jgi:hypothetical protein